MKSFFTFYFKCLLTVFCTIMLICPLHILAKGTAGHCKKSASVHGPVYPTLSLVVNDFDKIVPSEVEAVFQMNSVSTLRFLRLYPSDHGVIRREIYLLEFIT